MTSQYRPLIGFMRGGTILLTSLTSVRVLIKFGGSCVFASIQEKKDHRVEVRLGSVARALYTMTQVGHHRRRSW